MRHFLGITITDLISLIKQDSGHSLALCMIILDEILEEIHSLLGLNLIHFDQVLLGTTDNKVHRDIGVLIGNYI